MRTRDRGAAAFSAACLDRDGGPDLPAAAGVRAVHLIGAVRRSAVRSAAALPAAAPPLYRRAGRGLLPAGGGRGLPVPPAAGRRGAAGLCGAGRRGGRGAVLLRLFPAAAAGVGLLGGYPGLLGIFVVFSADVAEKFLQKNGPLRKKSLLFCAEMLYNKKNRETDSLQRGRQRWQKRRMREKSPAPAPVC